MWETEHTLAYYHTRPFYEVHIVVIPKQHITSILEVDGETKHVMEDVFSVIQKVANEVNRNMGLVPYPQI
ncbi:HIT family protein [Fictibacillus enclensis]|uniref:HIT family protein n=1 Tax=Fictibacillus enclensis TaxID=1017270 RepID=UPI00333515CD